MLIDQWQSKAFGHSYVSITIIATVPLLSPKRLLPPAGTIASNGSVTVGNAICVYRHDIFAATR